MVVKCLAVDWRSEPLIPGQPIRLANYERLFNGISLGLMEISEDLMRINMIQIDLMEHHAV